MGEIYLLKKPQTNGRNAKISSFAYDNDKNNNNNYNTTKINIFIIITVFTTMIII